MTVGSLRDLLWYLANVSGWLAILMLGSAWHARRKFHILVKAPLTEEVEHLTHVWERRVTRWTRTGLSIAAFSILCIAAWVICGEVL
jgi:hypothetical protein